MSGPKTTLLLCPQLQDLHIVLLWDPHQVEDVEVNVKGLIDAFGTRAALQVDFDNSEPLNSSGYRNFQTTFAPFLPNYSNIRLLPRHDIW